MTPYFNSEGVTLYQGDCLKLLPLLPANSIDLILTDPPYGIRYKSKRRDGRHPLKIAGDESLNALRAAIPLMDRVLKNDRHIYVFAAPTMVGQVLESIAEYWRAKNVLVWDKGKCWKPRRLRRWLFPELGGHYLCSKRETATQPPAPTLCDSV